MLYDMTLLDYLTRLDISISEFSVLVGYTRTHISNIINGRSKAGRKLLKIIDEKTDGFIGKENIARIRLRERTKAIASTKKSSSAVAEVVHKYTCQKL